MTGPHLIKRPKRETTRPTLTKLISNLIHQFDIELALDHHRIACGQRFRCARLGSGFEGGLVAWSARRSFGETESGHRTLKPISKRSIFATACVSQQANAWCGRSFAGRAAGSPWIARQRQTHSNGFAINANRRSCVSPADDLVHVCDPANSTHDVATQNRSWFAPATPNEQINPLRSPVQFRQPDRCTRKTNQDEKRNVDQRVAIGRMPDCDR